MRFWTFTYDLEISRGFAELLNMLQLCVERCGTVSPICRYVLTIISVNILHKCDETSLTVVRITVASRLSEKWPQHVTTLRNLIKLPKASVRTTFHLTISMRGQRATGKIQRNNYHHGNCGPSYTGKTSSVSLIFTHRTHRNVKNR